MGCSGDELSLAIDLRTDFAGGIEFTTVRTRLEAFGVQEREHTAMRGLPYLDGQRIGEFDGLAPGLRVVLVQLLDAEDRLVAERTVRLDQRSDFGITVLVTRDCANVSCPGADDDPSLDTCIGGVCADPTCSERDRSSCPAAECMMDAECVPATSCATGRCASGVCVFARDDSMCAAGEFCNPERGCRSETGDASGCDPVVLRSIASPSTVVGSGTPASCTEDAVRTAVAAGGVVTFDCGPTPHTIMVSSELVVSEDVTIDGERAITFDGGGASRIFHHDGDEADASPRLTLQRLTIAGGASLGGSYAVRVRGGSLEIIECTFVANRDSTDGTYGGGAVSFDSAGSGVVARSQFVDNLSADAALTVGSRTSITIVDSLFEDNTSTGAGGGIGSRGTETHIAVCGSEFRGNLAQWGGGIGMSSLSGGQSLRVSSSHFEDNDTEGGSGAGIYVYDASGGVYVETSTFFANQGSGIVALFSDMTRAAAWVEVTNSTFVDNFAASGNGAAMGLDGQVDGLISHCTFVGNRAPSATSVGGAIFTPDGSAAMTLRNSVFVGNESGLGPHNCNQQFVDGGGNIETSSSMRLCTATTRYEDPQLGMLADNGGPTLTVAPLPTSPAYGAGVDCLPTDQRGMPRASPCTSGAVE